MDTPLYPTSTGEIELTDNWAITLPSEFQHRVDKGSLVFWRDEITLWVTAYGTQDGLSAEDRVARDFGDAPSDATNVAKSAADGLSRVTYELIEKRRDGKASNALYTYGHAADAQIMIAFYFDAPETTALAMDIFATLRSLNS